MFGNDRMNPEEREREREGTSVRRGKEEIGERRNERERGGQKVERL